jgi:hypothetical protein
MPGWHRGPLASPAARVPVPGLLAGPGTVNDSPEEFEIRPSADQLPGLIFVPVPEAKQSKESAALWTWA